MLGMKLLVAALTIELDAFPAEIDGFDRLVTRAGKLMATMNLSRALTENTYDEILVLGTAGSIDPDISGGAYEIAGAIQHDVYNLEGVRGQHMVVPAQVSTGHDGVVIATGDYFVQDSADVANVRALGASLVDMETYAYIWVAQQFGVPIRVIKSVSDNAEDGAIVDWREQVTACSKELWTWFVKEYPQAV